MFQFPTVITLIVSVLMLIAYAILIMPKWNLRLKTVLIVSLVFSVIQVLLAIFLPSYWIIFGCGQCLLYDIGLLTHLLNGKRTMRDVVGQK